MTFEGEHKVFPIRGIERAGADNLCQDGAMNEVIGLEYKDGSYVPYAATEVTNTLNELSNNFLSGVFLLVSLSATIDMETVVTYIHYLRYTVGDADGSYAWKSNSSIIYTQAYQNNPSEITNIYSDSTLTTEITFATDAMRLEGGYYCGTSINIVRIHKTSVQDNVIAITDNGTVLWTPLSDYHAGTNTWKILDGISDVGDIEFVGNVACFNTGASFIFSKDKSNYIFYSDGCYGDSGKDTMADLPIIQLRATCKGGEEVEGDRVEHPTNPFTTKGEAVVCMYPSYDGSIDTLNITDQEMNTHETDIAIMMATKAQGVATENGRLTGYCMAVFAYKLRSGGYICASAPILLPAPGFGNNQCDGDDVFAGYNETIGYLYPNLTGRTGMYFSLAEREFWTSENFSVFKNPSVVVNDSFEKIPSLSAVTLAESNTTSSGSYDIRRVFVSALCNQLQYKIQSAIQSKYEGIIDGVGIFLSKQINPYDEFKSDNMTVEMFAPEYSTRAIRGFTFARKSLEDVKKELGEIENFYLVKYLKFDELKTASNDWENADLKGKIGDALFVREPLPLSAFNHNRIIDGRLYSMNGRLHVYNYTDEMFHGYAVPQMRWYDAYGQQAISTQETGTYQVYISVNIDDPIEGKSTVWRCIPTAYEVETLFANPLFSYPNKYAVSATIYSHKVGTNVWKHKTIQLTNNDDLNMAYYINDDLEIFELLGGSSQSSDAPDTTEVGERQSYRNSIKISETNNPIYFPLAYSETIGKMEILALSSFRTNVSQYNYANATMLAFCDDGIFTMKADSSGQKAYTNIIHLSRELCSNVNTIVPIDGAVLFASNKGLMMVSANSVDEFIPLLNGEPLHLPQSGLTYGSGMKALGKIISSQGAVQLWSSGNNGAISNRDFISYIKDSNTRVSYVSMKDKLIVYNPTKPYVYWIDIKSRAASKLVHTLSIGDNGFPEEEYVVLGDTKRVIRFDYYSNVLAPTSVECLVQSRPIKLAFAHKTAYRVVIRGYFRNDETWISGQDTKHYFAEMLVLGSLDGMHWQPIGYKEKSLYGGFHDIGVDVFHTSWKYMMIIFAGKLQPNSGTVPDGEERSHIDGMEMTVITKYNNKLK